MNYKKTSRLTAFVIFLIGLLIWTGCDTPVKTEHYDYAVTSTANKVHLAFAGGGWRAHTGHSAWVMSLLDNGGIKLDSAFTNVDVISSNSGGSWFSTMLMYSEAFVDSIQAKNAIQSSVALEGGWIGGQYDLFQSTGCGDYYGDFYMPCVFADILEEDAAQWIAVMEYMVYKNFPIPQTITLSDTTRPWAKYKPLLLASTMMTDEVVVNEAWSTTISKDSVRMYQACSDPDQPILKGRTGGYCSGTDSTQVTPVTFSRIPAKSMYKAPPFFSQNDGNVVFNVGYKDSGKKAADTLSHITINNPLNCQNVPVMVAAASSSAAGGFLASEYFEGNHDAADRAPITFGLSNQNVEYFSPILADLLSFDQLQSNKVVSLADGGPVDNSGVAQLVGFLQQTNGIKDTIHIVAFDNVTAAYSPGGTGALVGRDFAYLFGQGLPLNNKFCAEKDTGCVIVPDLQVFDSTALTTTAHTWINPSGTTTEQLIYTKYQATTVNNSVFGVSENTVVMLHAFSCIFEAAGTVPSNKKGDPHIGFDAYADMLKFITDGMIKNGGLIHLQNALGIQ